MRSAAHPNNLFLRSCQGTPKSLRAAGLPFSTALAPELIEFLKDKQINKSSRLQLVLPLSTKLLCRIVNALLLAANTASIAAHALDSWLIDPKHSVATCLWDRKRISCKLLWLALAVRSRIQRSWRSEFTLKTVGYAGKADYASNSCVVQGSTRR